jgi:hypothetical protein
MWPLPPPLLAVGTSKTNRCKQPAQRVRLQWLVLPLRVRLPRLLRLRRVALRPNRVHRALRPGGPLRDHRVPWVWK